MWNFDLSQMPKDEPVLVFLAEKHVNSRIHTGQVLTIANGFLTIVGSNFANEMPKILAWRTMVEPPGEAAIKEVVQ